MFLKILFIFLIKSFYKKKFLKIDEPELKQNNLSFLDLQTCHAILDSWIERILSPYLHANSFLT